jgi:hypothetical protein
LGFAFEQLNPPLPACFVRQRHQQPAPQRAHDGGTQTSRWPLLSGGGMCAAARIAAASAAAAGGLARGRRSTTRPTEATTTRGAWPAERWVYTYILLAHGTVWWWWLRTSGEASDAHVRPSAASCRRRMRASTAGGGGRCAGAAWLPRPCMTRHRRARHHRPSRD